MPSAPAEPRGARLHGWPRLALDLAWLSLALAAAGLALRLSVRDRVPGLALLHYLTPGAVIAAALACSGLCAGFTGRRRWRAAAFLVATAVAAVWWSSHRVDHPTSVPPPGRSLRLVSWNIAGPFAAWADIRDTLAAEKPDMVALIEARAVAGTRFNLMEGPLAELELTDCDHGLMVLSRWPVERVERGEIPGRFHWATLVVKHPAGDFRLHVADLGSNPLLPRRGQIEGWRGASRRDDGLPEVIAGDFNTPFDSVFLRPLRATHTHAFTASGRGLHVTWPNPLPVLALDHVWLRDAVPANARIGFSRHSDHGYLVVEVILPADGAPPIR